MRREGRRTSERDERERGSALIVVLMFGMGAMSLVLLLLTVSQNSIKDEAARHQSKSLNALLRRGMADSLAEINTYRYNNGGYFIPALLTGAIDLQNDGIGARLGTNNEGIEVKDEFGRSLGRYRTTLRLESGKVIMTVVAGYPDLDTSNPHTKMVASQVHITKFPPAWLNDKQPLSIVGPAGAGTTTFQVNSNDAKIKDPSLTYPALNVSDKNFYDTVVKSQIASGTSSSDKGFKLEGTSQEDPGTLVTGQAAATQDDPGTISPTVAQDVADGIDALAESVLNSGSAKSLQQAIADIVNAGDDDGDGVSYTTTLPGGTYNLGSGDFYVKSDTLLFNSSTTITGSGTLVISSDVNLNGGTIDWDGEVIVTDVAGGGATGANLTTKNGNIKVDGTLALQGTGTGDATLNAENGSKVNVNGVFLVMSDATSQVFTDSGARLNVNGLFILLGDGVQYSTAPGGGSNANKSTEGAGINGSMIMAIPEGSLNGIKNFTLSQGSHFDLTFNESLFDIGVTELMNFTALLGGDRLVSAIGPKAYWEQDSAKEAKARQDVDITNGAGWQITWN